MPELPQLKRKPVALAKVGRLARWLREWRWGQERRSENTEGGSPLAAFDAGSDASAREQIRQQIAEFDRPLATGQVRLMSSTVLPHANRPVYFALLAEWGEDAFLAAPFSPFAEPATTTEWLTCRESSVLRVLCLWNVRTLPSEVLTQSWLVDNLSSAEREDAWTVFRHATTGVDLESRLLDKVGSQVTRPDDPRLRYQADEIRCFTIALKQHQTEREIRACGERTAPLPDARATGRPPLIPFPGTSNEGPICPLVGLAELVAQQEMSLAAAEVRPSAAEFVFWTRDRRTMVLFMLEGSGGNLSISVWDAAGEPSNQLDGCGLWGAQGQVLATIRDGVARVPVEPFLGGFTIKTSAGQFVLLDLQS